MLKDVAAHSQQADKEQKGPEGRAKARADTELRGLAYWVNPDARVASSEEILEAISSSANQLTGSRQD